MSVSVSRDLTVMVEDSATRKLAERQEALKKSIQKGEPKVLGVSQVMVGLTVILHSLPLLSGKFTETVNFGVPWWSGIVFLITGAVAIAMDKHSNMKLLCACLVCTAVGFLVSILALIFYFIDLANHPDITPSEAIPKHCDHDTEDCNIYSQHLVVVFDRGVKTSLVLFTMAQTVICSVLSYNLYQERRCFTDYLAMDQLIPPTPTVDTPTEFN